MLVLLVLLAGAAGLDWWARGQAESRAATLLAQRLGTRPEVTAHGWPYLRSLLDGTVEQVDVRAPRADLSLQGHEVQVSELDVVARQVGPVQDPSAAKAGTLRGSALVGYEQMSRAMDATIVSGGGEKVKLSRRAQLLGTEVDVVVVAVPSVAEGRLQLDDAQVSLDGTELDEAQAQAVVDTVEQSAELPRLSNLSVNSLQASPQGLRLGFTGEDVQLSELG
ncbi:DUF2993 domain-containing protein [Luteococcus peritonei]|uniref:LmeA family phospholipid-binding protein n=1 Tax=Luteococcus peritonei TaxID=88874 RepID=UPI0031DD5166